MTNTTVETKRKDASLRKLRARPDTSNPQGSHSNNHEWKYATVA